MKNSLKVVIVVIVAIILIGTAVEELGNELIRKSTVKFYNPSYIQGYG